MDQSVIQAEMIRDDLIFLRVCFPLVFLFFFFSLFPFFLSYPFLFLSRFGYSVVGVVGDDEGRVLENGVSLELVRIALQEPNESSGHITPAARK